MTHPTIHRDWSTGLPDGRTLVDGRVRLVHGHLRQPALAFDPGAFCPSLLGDVDTLMLGPTKILYHERSDAGVVLNPGNVDRPATAIPARRPRCSTATDCPSTSGG